MNKKKAKRKRSNRASKVRSDRARPGRFSRDEYIDEPPSTRRTRDNPLPSGERRTTSEDDQLPQWIEESPIRLQWLHPLVRSLPGISAQRSMNVRK